MKPTKEVNDWAEKSMEILKDLGYLEKTNRPLFLIGLSILVFGMIVGGSVIYAMNHNAFKSTNINNQSVSLTPNITPINYNTYNILNNFTINNTIILPKNIALTIQNETN